MTEIITTTITATASVTGIILGGFLAWAANRRNNLTAAYQQLVGAQGELKKQIDAQDEKIDKLIESRDKLQYVNDIETSYIRALGHWLAQFCEITDPEFLHRHPKPSLPDELRTRIYTVDDNRK